MSCFSVKKSIGALDLKTLLVTCHCEEIEIKTHSCFKPFVGSEIIVIIYIQLKM